MSNCQFVRISDPEAIQVLKDYAAQEKRSYNNAATVAILSLKDKITSLSSRNDTAKAIKRQG